MPRPNTAHFPWHSLPIFWNVPESLTTQNVLFFFFFIIKSSEAIRPIWRPAVYILPCEDLTQINVVETIERRYHSNAIFWENICTNSRIHHPLPRLTPHFPYGWFSFWSRVVRVTSFSPVWSRWFSISSCPALILVLLRKKRGEKKKTPPERKSTISTLPPFKRVKKKTPQVHDCIAWSPDDTRCRDRSGLVEIPGEKTASVLHVRSVHQLRLSLWNACETGPFPSSLTF